ncbi:TGB1 protein [Wheat virus Q]|nr:TGB1 protein [Wheat virus Q]
MNSLVELLVAGGFERQEVVERDFIVVHAPPGSGKSTVLREFLKLEKDFTVVTFGKPDNPNLEGRYIRKAEGFDTSSPFIVDEYLSGPFLPGGIAYFSDPFQNSGDCLAADFISRRSHRFGGETCALLNSLGWCVESDLEDVVIFGDSTLVDPEGLVLAVDTEVRDFVEDHGVDCLLPCAARGLETEVVTVYLLTGWRDLVDWRTYVCLTRHRKKLLILEIDAS